MKPISESIIYIEFLDHASTTNSWQTYEEYSEDCKIVPCKVIGFLEKEDKLAFYLSTMKSDQELGSGHIILKSTITYLKKWSIKSHFRGFQHIITKITEDPSTEY